MQCPSFCDLEGRGGTPEAFTDTERYGALTDITLLRSGFSRSQEQQFTVSGTTICPGSGSPSWLLGAHGMFRACLELSLIGDAAKNQVARP